MAGNDKKFWTTTELIASGRTPDSLRGECARGEIHRIVRGLYSTEEPTDLVVLAALAWARDGLVYTGRTAAFLHSMVPMAWPAQASVPRGKSRDGGTLLQLSTARRGTTEYRRSVPTLNGLATAVTVEGDDITEKMRGSLLMRNYGGFRGNRRLAQDLAALEPSRRARAAELAGSVITGTASELEYKAVCIIVDALDRVDVTVQVNAQIRGYYFDIVIPEARVCIEIDSRQYHAAGSARREDFVADRWKGNAAVRWGWTLLRYPDASVDHAAREIGAEVLDTVLFNLANPRTRKLRVEEIPTDRRVHDWHRR
ncbi:hypothetical protein ACT3SZ_02905 [Corynebacterium sp. AOP40-9SA-29]|uniref:hypothetical protein n=1 Tax=Corynebacterium sp. AOP40-9SA-29 TaxID=3457677 RepID=UPI004034C9C5